MAYSGKPLQGCKFVLEGYDGQLDKEKEVRKKIESWGGQVESQVTKSTVALVLANKGKLYITVKCQVNAHPRAKGF